MNKSDLVKSVANLVEQPQTKVEPVVNAVFDTIGLSLACGEDVKITGFGRFETRVKKPVTRRNPKTGEEVQVPEKKSMGFKPSLTLKGRLNK